MHCPVRGLLKETELASDELTFTEEKRRIDCINFLLAKGYPKSHFKIEPVLLRFGHKGKNSLRADLAVLDAPALSIAGDPDQLKRHIRLVAEIKRDNADAKLAKDTQLRPALALLDNFSAFGVYWDDIEQRLFYRSTHGDTLVTHETTVAVLPAWGTSLTSPALTSDDLRPANLQKVFEKIENRLHAEIHDKDRRFEIMLQLLLAKLYDEHTNAKPGRHMVMQDFTDVPIEDRAVIAIAEGLVEKAGTFYGKYLPKPVPKKVPITAPMLRSVLAILAPVRIIGSKRAVIQDFYMYFAQGVYRWDLAQYFTPTEVVDFIVSLVNPRAGDMVRDPACGSGDFLISALHYARERADVDLRDAIWGSDSSENATQACVLNMVLNGDGKSNIRREDSLATAANHDRRYTAVLCNPPFGVRIVEKRFDVLRNFALGHEWEVIEGTEHLEQTERVLAKQETGLLFAELCVTQTEPGGRVGIILPNGYLGNQRGIYLAFREWLMRNTKLVAVVGFPRFTFKMSGADVSASVVVLERRENPLTFAGESENYPFFADILESVGWKLGDSRGEPIYCRDPESGAFVLNEANEPQLNADFARSLGDLWSSNVAKAFQWVLPEWPAASLPKRKRSGWSVPIKNVLARADLSIDPKRWCRRVSETRAHIIKSAHFRIGDVAEVVTTFAGNPDARTIYRYADIDAVTDGVARPEAMRGWELPDRAKHGVDPGDIFVGRIWSSVSKWFVADNEVANWRASSGFHRLKLTKSGKDILIDLVAGLGSEAYRIQTRAFCTGSDGLATISADDLKDVVLPKITDKAARVSLLPIVEALLAGRSTVADMLQQLTEDGKLPRLPVQQRSSHVVQV